MNKKKLIQALFIIIITAIFVFYIKKNFQQIKNALTIKPSFLFYLILLNMANKVFAGFKTKKITESFDIKLSFAEWFGSSVITNFYNYLAPKSGTVLMGVYFKNNHKLEYNKYLNVVITTAMITVLTSGVLGALVSLYAYGKHIVSNLTFSVVFIAMAAGPLVLLFMPKIYFPERGMLEKVNMFLQGWDMLRKNRKMLVFLSLADAGVILSMAARYYIVFKMFSLNIGLISCILISPINVVMHFATFVPGAYGIKEAAVGLVSKLTNIGFAPGALATLSDRIIMMTLAFILGPVFSLILFRRVSEPKVEEETNG